MCCGRKRGGEVETDSQNLKKISEEWLAGKRIEVKESTLFNYRYILNKYILPDLKGCALKRIDSERIRKYARAMEMRGIGAPTINKSLRILHMILQYAWDLGYDVAEHRKVQAVRYRGKKVSILSEEEQQRLLNFLFDRNCFLRREVRIGLMLSLFAGLRIGEVCALKWENIDVTRGLLSVEKTLSRIYVGDDAESGHGEVPRRTSAGRAGKFCGQRTRIEISEPKTENSRREIPLPGFLLEYLRKGQEERWEDPSFYVLTSLPRPMEPRTYSYHFRKMQRALDLTHCNYHMLRHTFATRCIEAGFDMKSLSEILGHSSVSTTLNLYAHPTMEMKRDHMEKLSAVFGF